MKPGIKTSEFWATILATIVVAGGNEFGLSLGLESVTGITLMVVSYVIGRVFSKNKEG